MRAPFSDSIFEPDYDEFMDEFEYEEFQKKKEMALLMFQDMLSKERGNVPFHGNQAP